MKKIIINQNQILNFLMGRRQTMTTTRNFSAPDRRKIFSRCRMNILHPSKDAHESPLFYPTQLKGHPTYKKSV